DPVQRRLPAGRTGQGSQLLAATPARADQNAGWGRAGIQRDRGLGPAARREPWDGLLRARRERQIRDYRAGALAVEPLLQAAQVIVVAESLAEHRPVV